MADPIASSSAPRYIEMNRAFGVEADKGKNLEVAMAATVFRDLQAAGQIPAGAKMADKLPSAPGLTGKTYESRLVELIRDRDGNGKLDLDIDRLQSSGILSGSPTADQVEGAISGAPRRRLDDAFIKGQSRDSGLTDYGLPNARGKQVQGYSGGMVLTNAQDRANEAFVSGVGARAATSPEEAKKVASEAILGAQTLKGKGDQRHAQELLTGTANELQSAGRLDDAARVYKELKSAPYANTAVNLVQDRIDSVRKKNPDFDPKTTGITVTNGGSETDIKPKNYESTYGALADRRLGQIEQTKAMQALTGKADFDPRNMADARDYFQKFSANHNTDEVRGEYTKYLQNFYNHAGQGVTWDPKIALDDRPGQMTDMLKNQPRDGAGRTIVDCEGYTYMNQAILGDLKRPDGTRRFDILQASRDDHVTSAVLDRASGQAFTVNNDQTAMMTGNLVKNDNWNKEPIYQQIAKDIGGKNYDVIGIGATPGAAQVAEPQTNPIAHGAPRVGTFIYDGEKIIGAVTPKIHDDFLATQNTLGPPSLSQYIGSLLEGRRTLGQ